MSGRVITALASVLAAATACISPSGPPPAIPPDPAGPAAMPPPPPTPAPAPAAEEPAPAEPAVDPALLDALARLADQAAACLGVEVDTSPDAFGHARAAIADLSAFRYSSDARATVELEYQRLVDALHRIEEALAPLSEQVPAAAGVMADVFRGHAQHLVATQMLTTPPPANVEPGTPAFATHRELVGNAARQFFISARESYEAALETADKRRVSGPCVDLARARLAPPPESGDDGG